MFINYNCPICGKSLKLSTWKALLGEACCATCGPASEWYRFQREDDFTRIILPPDKIPYLPHIVIGILSAHIVIAIVSGGHGTFIMTILSAFFVASMLISGSRYALNFAQRFLYPKEIICKDRQILLRVLADGSAEKTVDMACEPYSMPTVGVVDRNLPFLTLTSNNKIMKLGYGLDSEQLEEMKGSLVSFVDEAVGSASISDEINADNRPMFTHQEPKVVKDEIEPGQVTSQTEAVLSEDGQRFVLETVARWSSADWAKLIPIALGVVSLLYFFWEMNIAISISIGLGTGILALMQGIRLELNKSHMKIHYTFFGFLSREHLIPYSDIVTIGETGMGTCAVMTVDNSYRISHFNSAKSRYELAEILKSELAKRTTWSPRCRFGVKCVDDGRLSKVTLPASGWSWFFQSGVHPIILVPCCILFLPFLVGVELLLMTLFLRMAGSGELDPQLYFPQVYVVNLLLLALLIFELMTNRNCLSFEPSYPENRPTLTLYRPYNNVKFFLDEPVDIQCVRSEDYPVTFLKCAQGRESVHFGAGLNWEEQQELLELLNRTVYGDSTTDGESEE